MAEDPMEAHNRAAREFRRSLDASAAHFKTKMQRAVAKMKAAEERARVEMDQAKSAYEAELARARAKFHRELARHGATWPVRAASKRGPADRDLGEALTPATAEFQAELDRARLHRNLDRRDQRAEDGSPSEQPDGEAVRILRELRHARQELRAVAARAPRGARGARKMAPFKDRVQRLAMEAIKKPPKPPKRRRRGPDDGSEMAPVMPRPKPTPLMDGAEAPIE